MQNAPITFFSIDIINLNYIFLLVPLEAALQATYTNNELSQTQT